jgi:hypothetical protein
VTTPEPNQDEQDRAWRYYQHADNLHAARINFFMVAESMLVVSFATTVAQELVYLRYVITVLGLVYTACWFLVNRGIVRRMFQVLLPRLDSLYREYNAVPTRIESRIFLTYVVPIITLLFWMTLLGFQLYADIAS